MLDYQGNNLEKKDIEVYLSSNYYLSYKNKKIEQESIDNLDSSEERITRL